MQAHSSSGLLHSGHLFAIASPRTRRQLWPQLWPTCRGRRLAAAAATLPLSGNLLLQATGLAAAIWGRAPCVSLNLMLPPTSASDARGRQAKQSGSTLCLKYTTIYYYYTKGWGLKVLMQGLASFQERPHVFSLPD